MKTRELLDEYANNYSRIYDLLLRDENSTLIRRFRYENEEIIKELETSIRKEVVEDILEQLLKEARKTDYADRTEYDVAYDFIKGITLK